MFKGEEVAHLPPGLPESVVNQRIEDALGELGRVRIDKRGDIFIEPRDKFGSFLTEVTMTGRIRRHSDGDEVSIAYNCAPSVTNWILAVVLFLVTCFGALIILVPMGEKSKVAKSVRGTLLDLEESFEKN